MANLSLSIIPYQQITQEQAVQLDAVNVKFHFGYGKYPRKASFEITVIIEDIPNQYIDISGEQLTSTTALYNYILKSTGVQSKFLLFGKSRDHNIGSGFISNHLHFASFLTMEIHEFLLIKLNESVYGRLISGKNRLHDDLINAMSSSTNGANTVDDVMENQRNSQERNFLEMRNMANSLNTETVHHIPQTNYENPLTKITLWKRYSTLLYSLNNICFSIDEHFNNISRTTMLNEDVVKEICTEVLNHHKENDTL